MAETRKMFANLDWFTRAAEGKILMTYLVGASRGRQRR
jgi:hypothetical protein